MKKLGGFKYLLFFVMAGAFVYFAINAIPVAEQVSVQTVDGAARLEQLNLDSAVAVVGDTWESYLNKLYWPEDFVNGQAEGVVTFQRGVDSLTTDYGTHRMKLLLAPGHTYGIYFRSLDYATRVFIDGKEIDNIGMVGETKEASVPMTDYRYYFVTPQNGEIEIILQYANFYHKDGGNPPTLQISNPANIMRIAQQNTFSQCIIIGCLITAFLYHLGMYFLYGRRREFLYFSLTCLLFALRSFILVPLFFPVYNWHIAIRWEYIDIFAAFLFMGLFLRALFPKILSKWVMYTIPALLGAYLVIIVVTPPAFYTQLVIFYQAICTLMVLYATVKLAMSIKGGLLPNVLAFLGLLLFCTLTVNDALALNNLPNLGSNNLMPSGIIIFMFAYMLILAIEFAENERDLQLAKQKEEKIIADNIALEKLSRLKTEFLSNVSHELKTPLTVVSNYAQLSRRQMDMGEEERAEVTDNMRMIASEADRLALMVGQLLDVTRIEEGRMEWKMRATPAYDIIHQTVNVHFPILNKNNNRLEIDVEKDLPPVYADTDRIMQVLVNLISNAIKHTTNGVVTVRAGLKSDEPGFALISVSDTGKGIDTERLPHIFERFNAKDGETGTGLGLYISRNIVGSHGGKIWAESEPGKGTTILFTLPFCQGEEGEKTKQ